MSELIKLLRVERVGKSFQLEINGEVFPFAVADEPIETQMESEGGVAKLRLTLYAERLELVDEPIPSEVAADA